MSSTLILTGLQRSGKLFQTSCTTQTNLLYAFQGLCLNRTVANTPRYASSAAATEPENEQTPVVATQKKAPKMNTVVKAYMERAARFDAFMAQEIAEYETGRRHLANMMGENPETFTDKDLDAAIEYLFPSGLFDKRARPVMQHPNEIFQSRNEAQFDEKGRPLHTLFFTGNPNYYQILHDISELVTALDNRRKSPSEDNANITGGLQWISKEDLEAKISERISDSQYEFFITSLDRLVGHPMLTSREFINNFSKEVKLSGSTKKLPELLYNEDGGPYITCHSKRKTATAEVTVYGRGSGKITINGEDILRFRNVQDREQIVFPLQFSGLLGTVDVVAKVSGGGPSGQSGAIRHAISKALCLFVDEGMMEKMRLAGLLTRDPRSRERKKPGQKGARAKFTWSKR